jgi:hypothetical protein
MITDYMTGACHVLAVALHRAYGFKFLILTDKSERYRGGMPAVHHVYATDKNGYAYDYLGKHSAADVAKQWLYLEPGSWHRPGVVTKSTESGLRKFVSDDFNKPLFDYSDRDVHTALDTARSKLAAFLPPEVKRSTLRLDSR